MDDFDIISRRISSLPNVKTLGFVDDLPLCTLSFGRGPKVFISGGVHGDEPAGVHAALAFAERYIIEWCGVFSFTIIPCVNPSGLRLGTRCNKMGINLNRDFKKLPFSEECKLIQESLAGQRFVFAMDFHETWCDAAQVRALVGKDEPEGDDPDAFYLYEMCSDKSKRLGREIIENVSNRGYAVCTWPKIYNDMNNEGVVWYPEDCGTECFAREGPMDSYLVQNHTDHAFTIETHRNLPLGHRVDAHLVSLITALNKYKTYLF